MLNVEGPHHLWHIDDHHPLHTQHNKTPLQLIDSNQHVSVAIEVINEDEYDMIDDGYFKILHKLKINNF